MNTSGSASTEIELSAWILSWPSPAEHGTELVFEGSIESNVTDQPIEVVWSSDWDGKLHTETIGGPGPVTLTTSAMSAGPHTLTLEATQGGVTTYRTMEMGVCLWPETETFDTSQSLQGWTLFGNAAWDPGQWLEVTGNITNSQGALYYTERKVSPGDVTIEFSVATGGGINTGADGFSVNVINAYTPYELSTIVNAAAAGGCLGYGTSGGCGYLPINAFHIEFDTWYNAEYSDPSHMQNHTAIALDGDPTPLFQQQITNLEDLVWRDVKVEIIQSDVTVYIDGGIAMQGTIAGWSFDGGYIGVSGSTGAATNYHRFDNLTLKDQCEVPERTGTTSPSTP